VANERVGGAARGIHVERSLATRWPAPHAVLCWPAGDGQIAQVAFTFAHLLEDKRTLWLLWHEDTSSYERVQMPRVG
jgi:hypothetical protein